MGGFARRMSYWNAFARKFSGMPSLRLDGGSLFITASADAAVKNRWMLEGVHRSKLDAVNVTAWDVPVWQEMADLAAAGQIGRELLELPLVSANLRPKVASFPKVHRLLLREVSLPRASGRQSFRIGITGLVTDPDERIPREEFEIGDPQTAAREVIEELRSKTDYRIILTDMDLGKAISLAVLVPGINLISISRNYDSVSEPQKVSETLITIPVSEGKMISEARLIFRSSDGGLEVHSRLVPLDRTVPDDPEMGELVRRAQAEVDQIRPR